VGERGFGGVAVAGVLVGRAGELAAIVARARQASGGRPGVVWIEGEAGAGKTALLRAAVAVLAGEFQVLRAQADELAADMSFDVVGQLGVRDAEAPFPAGLELIGQWTGQPDGRPVLVVEDLHWADPESRLALLRRTATGRGPGADAGDQPPGSACRRRLGAAALRPGSVPASAGGPAVGGGCRRDCPR
jgi:hypothetical protein